MMGDGEADFLSGVQDRPERREYLNYLELPYKNISSKAFYTYEGSSAKVAEYSDLYKYSVGAIKGASYFGQFDADDKLDKILIADHKRLLDMLYRKRFPVLIGTESQMDYLISKNFEGIKFKKMECKHRKPIKVYFAISKKSPLSAYRDRINAVSEELIKTGHFENIKREFLHKHSIGH